MTRALWNVILAWTALLVAVGLIMLGVFAVRPSHAQARLDNLVSGSNSATGTGATTLIAAPSGTYRIYVTAVQCGRTDAGTTASRVTLNDAGATVLVLPNSAGGGANNAVFANPLIVASATALTFTSSASISTVYCNAQGFTGN